MTTTHPTASGVETLAARFPSGFLFGAATSSYQIEGAVDVDGRGPSIWDTYSHTPGRTAGGETGDVAVDHYHRFREDVALMADLGLSAYRFSIAWPRIVPDGDGEIEARGLAFYRRLVDALVDAGIEPVVTLYHWDLPQALQDRGGWANRDVVDAFTRYATIVHDHLGDAVRTWTTHNEPWCASFLGYGLGRHAPGLTDPRAAFRAAHHLLLSHGDAVAAMREQAAGDDHRFGIVPNLYGVIASGDDEADRRAAATIDALQNRLWLDTTLLGRYPDEVLDLHERFRAGDTVHDGDLERIAQPLDVLGVNYYSQHHVQAGEGEPTYDSAHPGSEHVDWLAPPEPTTEMGWGIEPHGLRDLLQRLHAEWPVPPILICENGAAFPDADVDADGVVQDADRQQFLADHLAAVADAIDAGVDVAGYLAWSLMDNFEWAYGYAKRFGIVRVDYDTLERTVKASGRWYRDLLAAHRQQTG
ncbi:GH1 family beta-glucosidase [Egicoccus halophilus]|uniref:Beta-glucosidase n=1 Tax=Egicoccus halophilus TaxID=1670830 RepID=A0A8J3ABZ5_9ACTN|nr:GH1 family beta-glucosidase [Egicoccus halophilus]GGI07954.1 beta-glucosidase [Egicoccus halophilus]